MQDAEAERLVLKAIRKHLRDSDLAAALAWLKKRVDHYKEWESIG